MKKQSSKMDNDIPTNKFNSLLLIEPAPICHKCNENLTINPIVTKMS